MASISSESHTISNGSSSRRKPVRGKGASEGEMRVEDLVIDIDADFSGDKVLLELGARRPSLKPRFPPHQAKAKGPSFRTSAVGRGMLYFFLSHSDSYYMHVLTNSF